MPTRAASVSRPCSGSCHSYTSQRSCLLFYGGLLGYFIGPNNPNLWARTVGGGLNTSPFSRALRGSGTSYLDTVIPDAPNARSGTSTAEDAPFRVGDPVSLSALISLRSGRIACVKIAFAVMSGEGVRRPQYGMTFFEIDAKPNPWRQYRTRHSRRIHSTTRYISCSHREWKDITREGHGTVNRFPPARLRRGTDTRCRCRGR